VSVVFLLLIKSNCLVFACSNNLYGNALTKPLPHSKYRWMDEQEFDGIDWSKVDAGIDGGDGYILEIDATIPPEHHESLRCVHFLVSQLFFFKAIFSLL
jgi:hypothetical protein